MNFINQELEEQLDHLQQEYGTVLLFI